MEFFLGHNYGGQGFNILKGLGRGKGPKYRIKPLFVSPSGVSPSKGGFSNSGPFKDSSVNFWHNLKARVSEFKCLSSSSANAKFDRTKLTANLSRAAQGIQALKVPSTFAAQNCHIPVAMIC